MNAPFRKPAAVDPVAAFRERADARAYLWHTGQLTLCEAVDELQETAVRDHLVEHIGQDAVQAILAGAFAPYRQIGEPLPVQPPMVCEDDQPAAVDLLADAIERTRPELATGSSKQRIRILWAAAVEAQHLGASDVIVDVFFELAVETELIDCFGCWGADIRADRRPHGADDVRHVLRWAALGQNPFEKD